VGASTIAAIASPPGGGERGILRLSGPKARAIVHAVWAGTGALALDERSIAVGRFQDARGSQPLLLLWMPGPRSFTREDVAEFHLPGSPPLLRAALERLLELGAVVAAPGEFTRRAFLSGRIDLARAEGVLELVRARDDAERRAATALLAGGLSDRVGSLRERLEDVRALVEASLDFDARDTGDVAAEEIERRLAETRTLLAEARGFEVARARGAGEPVVALVGAPNAGKSSLYNRLLGRAGAIVAPVPGTTRDPVGAEIDLDGMRCRLLDTAGLEAIEPSDPIDRAAQSAALSTVESAELLVWVVDASTGGERGLPPRSEGWLLAWNKVDLPGAPAAPPPGFAAGPSISTSAVAASGIAELRAAIVAALRGGPGVDGVSTRELGARHRAALDRAAAAVEKALEGRRRGSALELLAEDLREATDALDEVTGRTTAEDVLDRIFARFCLGK
jgi:tRNA modification GTPase